MISTLAVENYRSIRQLIMPLARLTVVTGANGTGKSSVYRSLRLLAEASRNGAISALAKEGGLPSTLWAGPETAIRSGHRRREVPVQGTVSTGPVALRLGFSGDEFGYAVDLGLPTEGGMFGLDPEIKRECIWAGPAPRPAAMLVDRANTYARIRDADGAWTDVVNGVRSYDSVLSELADPYRAPEVLAVREQLRSWRFYDHLRTDAEAPARSAQIGTRTPVLGHDGADLAAALATIREIGDAEVLARTIDRAFPGSRLKIAVDAGRFEVQLHQHGLLRPLGAAELSDGTLRYLLLTAALLTPRPPELLVLNEPETSLHPELLQPLAELIAEAADRTQLIVVTHSAPLIAALGDGVDPDDLSMIELIKDDGQTRIAGQDALDEPSWHWPER